MPVTYGMEWRTIDKVPSYTTVSVDRGKLGFPSWTFCLGRPSAGVKYVFRDNAAAAASGVPLPVQAETGARKLTYNTRNLDIYTAPKHASVSWRAFTIVGLSVTNDTFGRDPLFVVDCPYLRV